MENSEILLFIIMPTAFFIIQLIYSILKEKSKKLGIFIDGIKIGENYKYIIEIKNIGKTSIGMKDLYHEIIKISFHDFISINKYYSDVFESQKEFIFPQLQLIDHTFNIEFYRLEKRESFRVIVLCDYLKKPVVKVKLSDGSTTYRYNNEKNSWPLTLRRSLRILLFWGLIAITYLLGNKMSVPTIDSSPVVPLIILAFIVILTIVISLNRDMREIFINSWKYFFR